MMECGEIHNLTQEAPMASRLVSNYVAALIEVQIYVVLVWEVNESREGRAAPKIRQLSRCFSFSLFQSQFSKSLGSSY
jgi:hypothetical protein